MFKLLFADIKMILRNRQALFWNLMFPVMFIIIFGFFFGSGSSNTGTIALINHSESELATSLENTVKKSDLFKIETREDLNKSKQNLKKNKLSGIIEIPAKFGEQSPDASTKVKIIYDQANVQTNIVVISFIDKFLTKVNFQSQNVQPIYGIDEEKTTNRNLTYFDFVLIGLVGMALMNSSIQSLAINLSRYREDKIFKRLTITPLPAWRFIFAEVISRLFVNIIQISLILLIGIYGFGAHIYGNIFLIFIFSLLGAILFQSIGFVVAAVTKTSSAAEGMATAIAIPMMFLAGVFFPIDQLPTWLLSIVKYLPLAPLLRMLRNIALEEVSPFVDPTNIVIVLAWIIAMLFIAARRFRLSEE